MNKKKVIIAIILFIFLGLTVFTFANPDEPVEKLDGNGTDSGEVVNTNNTEGDAQVVATNVDDESDSSRRNTLTVVQSAATNVNASSNASATTDTTDTDDDNILTNADYSKVEALVAELENQIKDSKTINTARNNYDDVKEEVEKTVSDEEVQKALLERLNDIYPIIEDISAPEVLVNGEKVKEDAIYNGDIVITVNDDTATTTKSIKLNGELIDSIDTLVDGNYEITIIDAAHNETTIKFTYDSTAAEIDGITEEAYTYDGVGVTPTSEDTDIKTVELTKDGEIVEGYELGTAIVNAGVYELKVTDNVGNVATITFEIEKATPTIETVEPTLVYNGEKQEYEIIVKDIDGNTIENPSMNVVYKNADTNENLDGAPVDAGNYTIGIYVRPTDNYTRADKWFNFTVEKATPTIEVVEPSLVYNGEKQEYKVIVKGVNGEVIENPSMNVVYKDVDAKEDLDGAPADAGNYRMGIYVRPTNNYTRADKWFNFTVEKATTEFIFTAPDSLVYDMDAKEYSVKLMTSYGKELDAKTSVVYEAQDGTRGEALNAGKYTLIAHYAGDNNHVATYKREAFEIAKAETEIVINVPESLEYDGEEKVATASLMIKGTDKKVKDLEVVYDDANGRLSSAPVDAGEYTAIAYFGGDDNLIKSYARKSFAIEKTKVNVSLEYPEDMSYTGEAKDIKVKFTDANGNEVTDIDYSFVAYRDNKLDLEMKEVGRYQAWVSVDTDSSKYEFTNLSGNSYIEIFYITEAEVVAKTQVTMTVKYPEEGMTYTGNVKKLKLVFTDSEGNEITDIKASYSVLNSEFNSYVELKEVGKYMVKINISDDSLDKYDVDYDSWLSVEVTAPEKEYNHVLVALDKNYIDYKETVVDGKTEAVYTYKYDGNAKGFVLNLYHNGIDVTDEADIFMLYRTQSESLLFNAPSEVGTYRIYPIGMPSEYNGWYNATVVILPAE